MSNYMKFYAINGSPRKNKNTATLLQAALDGAKSAGATEIEIIHLYGMEYKSCISCFQCKKLGGKSYGKCALKDSLSPVLERLAGADGIIFGSPIFYGNITGKMKSFMERLLFPYSVYDAQYSSIAPKRMPTSFIYTMNFTHAQMHEMNYTQNLRDIEFFAGNIFTPPQILHVNNTYQFDDYSKYKVEIFSEEDKARHRREQFPADCKSAFDMGALMAANARKS